MMWGRIADTKHVSSLARPGALKATITVPVEFPTPVDVGMQVSSKHWMLMQKITSAPNIAACFISTSCMALLLFAAFLAAAAGPGGDPSETRLLQQAAKKQPAEKASEDPVPLNKQGTVLLDKQGKRLLLKAQVALTEGLLEMLCCPKGTKEHESILAVDSSAYVVHAGLVALGAEPGTPVQYFPEYTAPTGQTIEIYLTWKDKKGKLHRLPAQKWVRYVTHRFYVATLEEKPDDLAIPEDSLLSYDDKHRELVWYGPMTKQKRDELLRFSGNEKYRKAIESFYKQSQPRAMDANWVFAGSSIIVDAVSGKEYYEAEVGDLICVANFPSATIDIAARSSAEGEANLLFEAYTERIPPLGTPVTVELIPVFKPQ